MKRRTGRSRYGLTLILNCIFQQNKLPPAATVYTKMSARYPEHFQFLDRYQLDIHCLYIIDKPIKASNVKDASLVL